MIPPASTPTHFTHQPALLAQCLSHLNLRPGSVVIDGTVGGGGMAVPILERTAPDGQLIGLDLDSEALEACARRLEPFGDRVTLLHESFRNVAGVLARCEIQRVDAVLLDLGVSSYQLDTASRGFRFAADTAEVTPLDMRMDQSSGTTAADLLRTASPQQLEKWLREYADVPGARRLSRSIVEARRKSRLRTARDLCDVIREARIGRGRRHDPATLVFQALRIAVNDELGALEEGIEAAIEALSPGGRLVVLAYHSAEDRIVKNRMREAAYGCTCPPRTPVCICGNFVRLRVLTRKPIAADESEIHANPRTRSARLRAAVRVPEAT